MPAERRSRRRLDLGAMFNCSIFNWEINNGSARRVQPHTVYHAFLTGSLTSCDIPAKLARERSCPLEGDLHRSSPLSRNFHTMSFCHYFAVHMSPVCVFYV